MKTTLRWFLACLLFLALNCHAELIHGRVVAVADGDTVTVLDASRIQHKIRLAGIDAPEKAQAFGQRSKESLSGLVFGKAVTVETTKKDRYGRSVGKVLVEGIDANLVQIERGMAWFFRQYQKELTAQDQVKYEEAENRACNERGGLWSEADPTPPWDWRRRKSSP